MLHRGLGVVLLLVVGAASAEAAPVTVFLDREGQITDDGVEVPPFGGGNRVWNALVACVREQYAPFAVDIVEAQPASGHYITAVIGGRASLFGLDDRTTNGIGGYDGTVLPDQIVHVFSQVGSGERNVENLCAVTAHEVGHALGLDHEYYCGDIMSYFVDQCGPRKFLDVEASCGESEARTCGSGEASQNSYRRLGQLVGFRAQPQRTTDEPPPVDETDPWAGAQQADDPAPSYRYDQDTVAPEDPYAAPEDPYINEQAQDTAPAHECQRAPRTIDEQSVRLSRRDVATWRHREAARAHSHRHITKSRHLAKRRAR